MNDFEQCEMTDNTTAADISLYEPTSARGEEIEIALPKRMGNVYFFRYRL